MLPPFPNLKTFLPPFNATTYGLHSLRKRYDSQYPYLILVNALIPALLAGNSVIVKPSPQTPTIAEHVREIFEEAGLPKDVIQFFH